MSTVITVENLGKKYTLRHQQREQYTALRDVITNGITNFGKKLLSPLRLRSKQAFTTHSSPTSPSLFTLHPSPASEEFWALKDVSFEVKQGDRIGIIGRNGAGKSTLLKILSRITEPTTGSVRIKGRVASLLEVGTGFHPELTGRENIFLNGAILGMGRAEIKKKFDEIVDFSEIEKFLDTPVKRYSSGMYVRLAFAVAAHLEPEILIVDEVLAVGDAQFQKKCLGKMEDAGTEGRTIIFVSHNIQSIRQLCTWGIVLKNGFTLAIDDISKVVDIYKSDVIIESRKTNIDNKPDAILNACLLDNQFEDSGLNCLGCDLSLLIDLKLTSECIVPHLSIGLYNNSDELIAHVINNDEPFHIQHGVKSKVSVRVDLLNINLVPGEYHINLWLGDGESIELDRFERASRFHIYQGNTLIKRSSNYPAHARCVIASNWKYF
ncbi:MAG TPA: ATP-binding cassette domain-containing protein [Desulfuromonadales bacterium]|nr:ATP-binding cassette domain-containing protein [Desulfuromonadales bacterium]